MYDAVADPYRYPGMTVLKNLLDIQDEEKLRAFEAALSTARADEPLPTGRFGVAHYRAVHHHLFQDIYPWAGRFRTVRIGKGQNAFCRPEQIPSEMRKLFDELWRKRRLCGLTRTAFAYEAAAFLSALNVIHRNGMDAML
ncbi:MAG: Fic family protein [Alphaproteobacteria bacterium]|nr:Fic family protein [Alphaproteobacteria bacterium]